MPTVLAAAHIEPPTSAALDGVNLLPVLTRTAEFTGEAKRTLFWRHREGVAALTGRWKLLARAEDPADAMLFDLREDPGENEDVAERFPGRVREMLSAIDRWQHEVAATPSPSQSTGRNPDPAVRLPDLEGDELAAVQVLHFADLHGADCLRAVREFGPWLGIALGAPILRQELFAIPECGTINVHKSLLPELLPLKSGVVLYVSENIKIILLFVIFCWFF